MPSMGARTENPHWMAVPQFGGWDQKSLGSTDYSVVFSKARANRKQHKSEFHRAGLGGERELIAAVTHRPKKEDPPVIRGQTVTSRPKNKHAYVGDYNKVQHFPDFASPAMGAQAENPQWIAVPRFGGWDQKSTGSNNYSVVFAQARANRKQHKSDFNRASFGGEKELIAAAAFHRRKEEPNTRKKKKILTYISCCVRP